MSVLPFRQPEYEAKLFTAETESGQFQAAGTLCGHIDFVGPWKGTYLLSPDEAFAVINMLKQARDDVLENSNPLNDPRLVAEPMSRDFTRCEGCGAPLYPADDYVIDEHGVAGCWAIFTDGPEAIGKPCYAGRVGKATAKIEADHDRE